MVLMTGLFAVAYATTTRICYGKKPEKFIFDQGLMRRHLLKCLENKLMEEFPVRKEILTKISTTMQLWFIVHVECQRPKMKT